MLRHRPRAANPTRCDPVETGLYRTRSIYGTTHLCNPNKINGLRGRASVFFSIQWAQRRVEAAGCLPQ